jgi:uncharacterized membrane protein YbhN (UPF0104 family)
VARARRVASFAAALLALAILVALAGPRELVRVVAGADPALAASGILLALAGLVLLGLAWDRIVGPALPDEPRPALGLYFATLFLNLVTPFGQAGGEPAMAALVTKTSEAGPGEALGRMVGADVVNTAPFFTLTFAGAAVGLATVGARSLVVRVALLSAGLLVLLAGAVLLVAARERAVPRLARRLAAGWGRLLGAVGVPAASSLRPDPGLVAQEAREAVAVTGDLRDEPGLLAVALGFNHAAALVDVAAVYVLLLAVGAPPARPGLLLLAFPASMLAIFLPFPGGLGGVEATLAALVAALSGVPLTGAVGAALLYRVGNYGGGLAIGAAALASRSVDAASGGTPR